MESQEPKRKRQINPDRIVLEGSSVDFIKSVSKQIENAFGGVIKLTYKEIANFILQSRIEPLSASELIKVKEKYFDDVRAAQWALQRLKDAKESGDELTLAQVLNQIQTPVVREKRKPKSSKGKSEKIVGGASSEQGRSSSDEAVNALNRHTSE